MKPPVPRAIPLDTARLHLREPVEQDASAIIAICSDWEVVRRLGRIPHPYTRDHVRFFFNHVVPNGPTWAILQQGTSHLIGIIGLAPAVDGLSAELGYYIARSYWRHGVATEAARAVVDVGFESFGYRKLTSGYHRAYSGHGRPPFRLMPDQNSG